MSVTKDDLIVTNEYMSKQDNNDFNEENFQKYVNSKKEYTNTYNETPINVLETSRGLSSYTNWSSTGPDKLSTSNLDGLDQHRLGKSEFLNI